MGLTLKPREWSRVLPHTNTALTTPLAEKFWLEEKKRSHDYGINSKDTIPDRIPLATKYREEMYYSLPIFRPFFVNKHF